MRTHIIFAAGLLLAAPLIADTTVDEACAVGPEPRVTIRNSEGSVRIVGWDEERLALTGTLGDNVTRLDFSCDQDRVEIEVVVPARGRKDQHADLVLNLPRRSDLQVNVVSAELTVDAIEGDIRLQSVSGDIIQNGDASELAVQTVSGAIASRGNFREVYLKSISGEIEFSGDAASLDAQTVSAEISLAGNYGEVALATTSGDIGFFGAAEKLEAKSISGDLELGTVHDSCEASSVSGDIDVSGDTLDRVELESVSGEISINISLAADAHVSVNAFSGDVAALLPADASGSFHLRSFNGGIKSDFGPAPESKKVGPGTSLNFRQGTSNADIQLESHSGSVSLRAR